MIVQKENNCASYYKLRTNTNQNLNIILNNRIRIHLHHHGPIKALLLNSNMALIIELGLMLSIEETKDSAKEISMSWRIVVFGNSIRQASGFFALEVHLDPNKVALTRFKSFLTSCFVGTVAFLFDPLWT